MLRARLDQSSEGLVLKLEGQLVSAWAVQVKAHVSRHFVANGLLVDMSDVTYVDSTGEQLLLWLRDLHARFMAGTCYARDICERLHLNHKGDTDGSIPSVTEVHHPPAPPPPPGRSLQTRPGAALLEEMPNSCCSISTNPKAELEKICSE
jgi:ABC-type transporter Mla MlaB component